MPRSWSKNFICGTLIDPNQEGGVKSQGRDSLRGGIMLRSSIIFALFSHWTPFIASISLRLGLPGQGDKDRTTLDLIMTSYIPFLSIPKGGKWVQVRPIVWHCLVNSFPVFKESHLQGRQLSSILVFPPSLATLSTLSKSTARTGC